MLFCKLKREVFSRIVQVVSICMTLMLGVTLLTLAMTNQGFSKKPSMSVTTENMFAMSRDSNFVILLLDAVDAQVLEGMLETEPEYQDIFTDFTFYDNVVAAYPYTQHSIPYILSGSWYENETSFKEYEREAYAQSPFLEAMESAGYHMGLYEADLLLDDGGMGRFEKPSAPIRLRQRERRCLPLPIRSCMTGFSIRSLPTRIRNAFGLSMWTAVMFLLFIMKRWKKSLRSQEAMRIISRHV